MNTHVLISGAWLGPWAWAEVTDRLRSKGCDVLAATLPGLGERAAEASSDTDMETYVADVIEQIVGQDLEDVILVGHSFGGAVAGGVADRIPSRLSRVVYVDSGPLPSGSSYIELFEGPQLEFINALVESRGDGWLVPMPAWDEFGTEFQASLEGLGPDELRMMGEGATPQPFKTWSQPLVREMGEEVRRIPKTLIASSFPLAQVEQLIAVGHPWFAELSGPEWDLVELPTGHWPMFSRPKDLADLLLEIGAARS